MDISKSIKMILDLGAPKDLLRLGVKLNHLARLDEETINNSKIIFLDNYGKLINEGGMSFEFMKGKPPSIYHSCIVLNQLIDLDLLDYNLVSTIKQWLFTRWQEDGWWKNVSELGEHVNLEIWEDDSEISVLIFHACLVLATLAKLDLSEKERKILIKSYEKLNTHRLGNGLLIGFQQSNWLLVGVMKFLKVDQEERDNHISIVSKYLETGSDIKNLILLMEILIENGLDTSDPVIKSAKEKLMEEYLEEENYAGWKVGDQLDPGVTLAGLIIYTKG